MKVSIYNKYETVIGLEVHIQLLTKSKAYSSDSTEFGDLPNSNTSPISLGHPGTIPKVNKKIIEYAVKLGLAVHSKIRRYNEFARKNYFYADSPKGYQITQYKTPVCNGGYISIKNNDSKEKLIHLTRIHIEEDAGKSIHNFDNTLIDLNRAGIPLLEIVSEPEIHSAEEAAKFLSETRKLVRYLGICSGNMEQGSLRCDVNVSVHSKTSKEPGTKVEIKNMNSVHNVKRAIEYEVKRQIEAIENGENIVRQTRSFNAAKGATFTLRTKEEVNDYRYFPEPDLCPVIITQKYIDKIKKEMPCLPEELFKKYTDELGLSDYDAEILTESKEIASYFEKLIKTTSNYKAATNLLMGPIKKYLNKNKLSINEFNIKPEKLSRLIQLIDKGEISNTTAKNNVLPLMIKQPDKSPFIIAKENNLIQETDIKLITKYIKQIIAKHPDEVERYKSGKKGLIGFFTGEVMKLSKGKAEPKLVNQLIMKKIDEKN